MATTHKMALAALPLLLTGTITAEEQSSRPPNIIFILADDMGYGDVSALNENSKINTPNLDRMVGNGVAFTDAHSSSSVSTPTRYGILTGRYNWRSPLKSGVLFGYDEAIIPHTRTTIASLLKQKDYTTGCIGKWHLGWTWNNIKKGPDSVDYSKPITHGPVSLGFDYFFGISGSLDMTPYVYVENDMPTAVPNHVTANTGMGFWRKGPTSPDFVHEQVLPNVKDRAISFINKHATDKNPFFLYLPLPAPHAPILPSKEFRGKSGLNEYGDFVMMVDWVVGEILNSVNKAGIDQNTLIVFTTDNGCSPAAQINELIAKGHHPNYIYRGHKADLFDGGHHIPCIVQWKGSIAPGKARQTVCLTDFFSTFANIAGISLQNYEGEDSYNLLPVLKNVNYPKTIREATVHHSINGEFSIRKGDWKLLISPSSGGWSAPQPGNKKALTGLPLLQLYNLKSDPGEAHNLAMSDKDKTKELMLLMRKYIKEGRSTPGTPQQNDLNGEWKQLEQVFKSYPDLM